MLTFSLAALLSACGGGEMPAFKAGSPTTVHSNGQTDLTPRADNSVTASGAGPNDGAVVVAADRSPEEPIKCVTSTAPQREVVRGPESGPPGDGDGPNEGAAAAAPPYVVPPH